MFINFRPKYGDYDVLLESSKGIDLSTLKPPKKLKWNIPPEVTKTMQTAKDNTDK